MTADGTARVLAPPLVNTDDLGGANPATFPLAPSGANAVPASSPSLFFHLKAAER